MSVELLQAQMAWRGDEASAAIAEAVDVLVRVDLRLDVQLSGSIKVFVARGMDVEQRHDGADAGTSNCMS